MVQRKKTDASACALPDLGDVINELIQDDDETSRRVMRTIWKELQETRCVKR
jgi:hypothetical protein